MKKLHPLIKSEMLNTFQSVKELMLGKNYDNILQQSSQGFLSSVAVKPPTLGGGYKATHTL